MTDKQSVSTQNEEDRPQDHSDPDPVIEAYRSGIDRSLIQQNLRLTVDQRFEQLMSLQRLAEELRAAGKRHQSNG